MVRTDATYLKEKGHDELEAVALAFREGLMSLADAKTSTFYQFPSRACGVTAELIGRVTTEVLKCEGKRVAASQLAGVELHWQTVEPAEEKLLPYQPVIERVMTALEHVFSTKKDRPWLEN